MITRRTRTALAAGCALAAVLAAPGTGDAHPHVWTTVETEIVYGDNQMVAGFRHKWTFDELYSAFAAQGLDQDGDGVLSRQELQPLADENVFSLKEFEYFTYVTVDGRPAELLEPRDHYLEQVDGVLVLHFTLPLKTPVDARFGDVGFSVYDPTYFVAFSFAEKEPVRLASAAPAECRARVEVAEAPDSTTQSLSEAFFNNLGPGSDFGASMASKVAIDCARR